MVGTPSQVCILGGGFGGLFTALYLSRYRWPQSAVPQITLVEQRDHFLFTPLLYELITGELQTWHIAPSFQKLLAGTNVRFCQAKVQVVDLEKQQVQLQDGEILTYDRLVLAVGRGTLLDVVPGAADHAFPFRTLTDVNRLEARLQALEISDRRDIRIVVAGGGPSGVELACKLADRLQNRGQVRLVDRGKQILKDFSVATQKASHRALAARQVKVDLETSIEAVEADHITLSREGQAVRVPADLVLWTVGTRSWDWVQTLSCRQNDQGQLLALPTLQLVDHPEVLALGDLADVRDAGGKQVPATAQATFQQSKTAARNLRASLRKKPLLAFRYLHLGEMMTLGFKAATVYSFGLSLEGSFAAVIRQWAYLFRLPTFRHRFQVAKNWLSGSNSKYSAGTTKVRVRSR